MNVMRIVDRSTTLSGFIRYLWSLLHESVASQFGAPVFADVPTTGKNEILSIIAQDFQKESCFAFDAAFVLNPCFRDEIMEMAAADPDEPTAEEWTELRETTLDIMDHVLKRKLNVAQKVDKFDEVRQQLHREFREYVSGIGMFQNVRPLRADEDPLLYWEEIAPNTWLKQVAVRILRFVFLLFFLFKE